MKKLALVLPVLVVIAAIVFFAVHRREKTQHVNRELRAASVTHFTFDQQQVLARTACAGGRVTVDKDRKILCSVCPAGSDFAAPGNGTGGATGWTMDGAIAGSFSAAHSDEALVHAVGCESHAKNYGGDFLLRRSNGAWSNVRYASAGTANNHCQVLPWKDGRDALVCEVTDMHQGEASDAVELLQFDAAAPPPPGKEFMNAIFLSVIDDSSNCSYDASVGIKPSAIQIAKIEKFEVLPAGEDGLQDVSIDATIARVNAPAKVNTPCPAGTPQTYRLVFDNRSDHFDAGEGYVSVNALKREDCCEVVVNPRVVPGRY